MVRRSMASILRAEAAMSRRYSRATVPLPEKALIARVRQMAAKASAGKSGRRTLVRGIGDDCAVLTAEMGQDLLVTTDFSLEGVHFRRDWHPADAVGWRCLARGLSDIAAMGGEPVAAFLSLALPRSVPQSWVRAFFRGFLKLAKQYHVLLGGGDTAESPQAILADIVVVGMVPKGWAILRSGARPGDRIYVSGDLGGSATALRDMTSGKKASSRQYPRHFYPEPRIALGGILREKGLASSMIDVSDGLSTDLAHICEESGVGAKIDAMNIPRACVGKAMRQVELDLALHGGEDYELLFTARPGKRVPRLLGGVQITHIGEITRSRKILITESDGSQRRLAPKGWEHFRE